MSKTETPERASLEVFPVGENYKSGKVEIVIGGRVYYLSVEQSRALALKLRKSANRLERHGRATK